MSAEEFVKVASLSDVPPGTLKTFKVKDEDVVVANSKGKIYAIRGICNHRQWDLSEGTLEGDFIICAGHGARWSLVTGEGQFPRPLPPEPVYEVQITGNDIYLRRKGSP